MDKLEPVYRIAGDKIMGVIHKNHYCNDKLQEIRMRANRPLIIRYDGENIVTNVRINEDDLHNTFNCLSGASAYAYEEEIRNGYITIAGGHRVGFAGKTVIENSTIKSMKCISFINIRIASEQKGCADSIMPFLYEGERVFNTLIVSPPGAGKTTLLRDIIRQVSNGSAFCPGKNTGVVDERSEICACYNGIPQNDVGMRTDVLDGCPKTEGMMMLLRSMSPEVIAVDEIGTKEDMQALYTAMICGCHVITTHHGYGINDVIQNSKLDKHFERIIVLSLSSKKERTAIVYDVEGRLLHKCILN